MKVTYKGPVEVKMRRIFPKQANYCKLTVYSNALNYFGSQPRKTPESLLEELNLARKEKGQRVINPHKEVVSYKDLDSNLRKTGIADSITLSGERYLNIKMWKQLLKSKAIICPNHQLFYYPLRSNHLSLKFIPKNLLSRMQEEKFSYQTFTDFYSFLIRKYKSIDEGHIDICLGVKKVKGKDYIILANLNSSPDKSYVRIPWNFYKNYMSLDWENLERLKSLKQLPSQKLLLKLQSKGNLNTRGFQFVYGLITIFFKTSSRAKILEILES